jgi:hypothetical protein
LVEFSLFYSPLPPNLTLFLLEGYPKVELSAGLSQSDFFPLSLKPDSLPQGFYFPMALKVASANNISLHALLKLGDFNFFLSLPNLNSSPIFGTSSLPSYNLPIIAWKRVDLTIYDTLEPAEVKNLISKTPIVWHLKGYATITPQPDSRSEVKFFPVQVLIFREIGSLGFGLFGNIAYLGGKGHWKFRYLGSEFLLDTFWVEGVKFEAEVFKQLYTDSVGLYSYEFSIKPFLLYNFGTNFVYTLSNFKLALSFEYLPNFEIPYTFSGRYLFVDSLYGAWRRKYSNFKDLYAEYLADTVVIKGSGIVGFMSDSQAIRGGNFSGEGKIKVKGRLIYSTFLSYNLDRTKFFVSSISNRGISTLFSFGGEYGFRGFLFYPFWNEWGYWRFGGFAEFESINFYLYIGRNFGRLKNEHFEVYVPPISRKLPGYIYGLGLYLYF